MRQYIPLLLLLALILTAGTFAVSSNDGRGMAERLEAAGFDAPPMNATIVSSNQEDLYGITLTGLQARAGNQQIEAELLTDVEASLAHAYLQDRRQNIMSLYLDTIAPYDGILEQNVNCSSRFRPEISSSVHDGINYTYYTLYADDERSLGACSEDEAQYRATILTVYCPDAESALDIRAFHPTSEPESGLVDVIRCHG